MGVWILPCPAEKGGAWFPQEEMPESVLSAATYGCPGALGDTVRPGLAQRLVCVCASFSECCGMSLSAWVGS